MAVRLGDPWNLEKWLRERWQFVPDPPEYEFVQAPVLQLYQAAHNGGVLRGDCDDAATLAASILAAMQWPCRFVAIKRRGGTEYEHVFVRIPLTEYSIDGRFQFDIDPIVPAEALPLAGDFETMVVNVWGD